jgi:hypothetical protein
MTRSGFLSSLIVVAGFVFVGGIGCADYSVQPIAGVPQDGYSAELRGPSLDDAIRAAGDSPENVYED